MPDTNAAQVPAVAEGTKQVFEFGGLGFDVSFRDVGATLRVKGRHDGKWTEMLRFDDFVDGPHFHVPASGPSIQFDRSLGDPLAWYVTQVRDHLAEWLQRAGFEDVLTGVDLDEVAKNADTLTEAMIACVPGGYVRVPGIGLQRVDVPA
jgi:hypothetical protein